MKAPEDILGEAEYVVERLLVACEEFTEIEVAREDRRVLWFTVEERANGPQQSDRRSDSSKGSVDALLPLSFGGLLAPQGLLFGSG